MQIAVSALVPLRFSHLRGLKVFGMSNLLLALQGPGRQSGSSRTLFGTLPVTYRSSGAFSWFDPFLTAQSALSRWVIDNA